MLPSSIQSNMTIYNIFEDSMGGLHLLPTILRGIFWRDSDYVTLGGGVVVIIPKAVNVGGKIYMPSIEFLRIPDITDKANHWTIRKGDKIINQVVTEPITREIELEERYGRDNVMSVTSFVFNDFGSDELRHFKIIGK